MPETSTLAFTLTYLGTLGLAFLMFLGQLAACGILLVVVGIARLITHPIRQPAGPSQTDRT